MTDALSLSGARFGSRGSLASIHSSCSADSISSWGKDIGVNILKKGGEDAHVSTTSPVRQQSATLIAASPYRNVDAIILVYDLGRIETFNRLESHWLPLIEKCYNGDMPVILVGNKMDLQSSSVTHSTPDNQFSVRSRQEVILLLQKFHFIRQYLKCSAKNLINLDEVFQKAQQAVLYPILPLYDLSTGRLTPACSRALTRIFRILDKDLDGLLSAAELNEFQQHVWGVNLMERDFMSWKKVVQEHDSYCSMEDGSSRIKDDVIRGGKFTVAGFLTIFDVFISQNRLEVLWNVLRKFGYDDQLNLIMPASMLEDDDFRTIDASKWKLDRDEELFLSGLFHQFDLDGDGVLTPEECRAIFSVLPTPLPPWSERRKSYLFSGCVSMPRTHYVERKSPSQSMDRVHFDPTVEMSPIPPSASSSSPSSPTVLSATGLSLSSSPLPSLDTSKGILIHQSSEHMPQTLSYTSWMSNWHMVCTASPSICRAELYRLGYPGLCVKSSADESCSRHAKTKQVAPTSVNITAAFNIPTIIVQALVVGGKDSGLAALTSKLHGEKVDCSMLPCLDQPVTNSSVSKILRPAKNGEGKPVETNVHLILTEVHLDSNVKEVKNRHEKLIHLLKEGVYDMAILAYNSSQKDETSFDDIKRFETTMLNEKVPRIFVGASETTGISQLSQTIDHCIVMDLEPPQFVPLDKSPIDSAIIHALVCCAQRQSGFRCLPGERARKIAEKKRKLLLWFGVTVTAGITAVLGLSISRKKRTES